MRKRTIGMLLVGVLLGVGSNRFIRKKRTEIGVCSPALDEWGLEMRRLIDEYNSKHPDAPLLGEDAYKHFLDVNPYPTSIKLWRVFN